MMPEQDVSLSRDSIEGLLRAGMKYGWELGRVRGTEPEPLFDLSSGVPLITAELSEPKGSTDG